MSKIDQYKQDMLDELKKLWIEEKDPIIKKGIFKAREVLANSDTNAYNKRK